jgi:hypothetical protein
MIEKEFLCYSRIHPKKILQNIAEPPKQSGPLHGVEVIKRNKPEFEPQHYFPESKYVKNSGLILKICQNTVIRKSIIRNLIMKDFTRMPIL